MGVQEETINSNMKEKKEFHNHKFVSQRTHSRMGAGRKMIECRKKHPK